MTIFMKEITTLELKAMMDRKEEFMGNGVQEDHLQSLAAPGELNHTSIASTVSFSSL